MIRKTHQQAEYRKGFSLIELLVVIGIIGILLGMLMPTTRGVREAARRTACSNNMRQLGLSALNYESAYLSFPSPMRDARLLDLSNAADNYRLSGLLLLMPFTEQRRGPWIDQPLEHNGIRYPAYPSPTNPSYPFWQRENQNFLCPSSVSGEQIFAETSYVFCIGDAAINIHDANVARGASAAGLNVKLQDITDGTSNTIYMSEVQRSTGRYVNSQVAIYQSPELLKRPDLVSRLRDPFDPKLLPQSTPVAEPGRGGNLADGSATSSMFNTILPPGSPNAAIIGKELVDGYYSAGSYHSGGINIVRADASVSFVDNDIDCGDLTQAPFDLATDLVESTPSPYGVWGGLGTINGAEEGELN